MVSGEWVDADAEFERSDRIASCALFHHTGKALEPHYEQFEPPELEDPNVPSPAILAVARMLPGALSGLPRVAHVAVAAQHFEGWGAEYVLNTLGSRELLALLKARDEWPPSDEGE